MLIRSSELNPLQRLYHYSIEDGLGENELHSDMRYPETVDLSIRLTFFVTNIRQCIVYMIHYYSWEKAQRLHYRCTGFSASLYVPAARRDCLCECFLASLYVPVAG